MIPNWKFWTFLLLIPVALPVYASIGDSPWRLAVNAVVTVIFIAFFTPHTKRLVEVPREP